VFSYCSTLARRDTTLFGYAPGGGPGGHTTMRAGYDALAGRIYADGDSGPDGSFTSSAVARDRYTLFGPASPGPIAFTARLHVVGFAAVERQLHAGASAGASLREGSDPAVELGASAGPEGYTSIDQELALPIRHFVGESFELTYTASASGYGLQSTASISGQFSFADLPPGYGVSSCQGFSGGPVVALAPTSWGKVKIRYR